MTIKLKRHLNFLAFIRYTLAAAGVPALVFVTVQQSTMHQKAEAALEAASSTFSQKYLQRASLQPNLLTSQPNLLIGRSNLLIGATLVACNTTGGSAVLDLNDGNLHSSCLLGNGSYAVWDLGATCHLTGALVQPGLQSKTSRYITVEVSAYPDMRHCIRVIESFMHSELSASFNQPARYVRLRATEGGGECNIAELAILGTPLNEKLESRSQNPEGER